MNDYFGISDRIKSLTAPAGLEAVHQDGFSWAKQGTSWETSTRWNAADLNRFLAQWRGLMTIDGVDLSDLDADSPFILKEALLRSLPAAVLDQAAAVGAEAAAVLGEDVDFQALVAAAAGAPNQQLVSGESVQSKSYVPGGLKKYLSSSTTGGLRIKLPLTTADSGQFVTFWVDCYNYSPQASCSFQISFYLFVNAGTQQWVSPSVRQIGGTVRHPVAFGHDGTNPCIQIGDLTYGWGYPIFRIRDISGNTGTKWTTLNNTPWVMTIEAAALASVYTTVYDGKDVGAADTNGAASDATTDLNTHVKWGGFWNKPLATGAPNIPAAGTWMVEYQRQNDLYGVQVAWPNYGNTLAPYLRRNAGASWSAWKALAWADDYVPKAGGTFTGAISFSSTATFTSTLTAVGNSYLGKNGAATGYLHASPGSATQTGFVGFHLADGTRLAYVGYAASAGWINMVAEAGAAGWRVFGALDITGAITHGAYSVRDTGNTPNMSDAEATAGTDTTPKVPTAAQLKLAAETWGAKGAAFAIVADQKASGTMGGASVSSAWTTRTLNTEVKDPLDRITLSSNTFVSTVNAEVEWSAPGYQINAHMTRLYNVTDSVVVAYGTTERSPATYGIMTRSFGRADIVAGKTYRIEHYCATTDTNGFGYASYVSGATESYTVVAFFGR